jgi:hypothetical protein
VLKRDSLGQVERLCDPAGNGWVRRAAVGSRWPLSACLARLLLRRERRALVRLAGLGQVPQLHPEPPTAPGERSDAMLLRSWLPGVPLWQAEILPADFFAHLAALVQAMHRRGVCHNDLHKENNILVGPGGWPALVDFQLASCHASWGRGYRRRCAEDLRHVAKHAARYAACGRGTAAVPHRGGLARVWRWSGKLLYNVVVRWVFGARGRGEPRRPKGGPWPRSGPPLGAARH